MKIWAVANQKGGVGKTTTAISLAGWLSLKNKKTLMVDLDPHGSLSSYFGLDPDSLETSVYTVFQKAASKQKMDINEAIYATQFDYLSILPASTAIATLDKQLGTREGMGLVLARQLLNLKGQFDYIFIDCPPMLGILMINALAACDQLLIPVQTEHLALKGLDRMLATLAMINRARKVPLNYAIIPTMFDRRTRAAIECLRIMQNKYDAKSLKKTIIPVDTKFREAARDGIPIPIFSPHTRGATAYNLLLDTLLAE
ncbi:MAG: ParA family protein [gamma proteobacterium symbiont of Taylorina sp.]|nr:ParA family protein [gamma proteobacterium symbiont of Taylorina sp.]